MKATGKRRKLKRLEFITNISTDIYDQNTFHRYLKLFWLQIQTGNLATYISSMPSPSVTKSEKYLVTKVCEGLEPTC